MLLAIKQRRNVSMIVYKDDTLFVEASRLTFFNGEPKKSAIGESQIRPESAWFITHDSRKSLPPFLKGSENPCFIGVGTVSPIIAKWFVER